MYYLYSLLSSRYEFSFNKIEDLIAYLSHFNTYIDKDHSVINELASGAVGDYTVNYFVGIRLQNAGKELRLIKTSEYPKRTIEKIIKNCKLQTDADGNIIANDLIILDQEYKKYCLDVYDIDAILRRLCSYTEYKSVKDIPNFKYRSTAVPGVRNYRFKSRRGPSLMQEKKALSDSEYFKYSRTKRLKIRIKPKYKSGVKSWKKFGKYSKQWELGACRNIKSEKGVYYERRDYCQNL